MHPYPIVLAILLTHCGDALFAQSANKIANNSTTISAISKLKLITANRLAKLSEPERVDWEKYLAHSEISSLNERSLLATEIAEAGLSASRPAPNNSKEFELGSKVDAAWLKHPDTLLLANVVLSYQTPSGGWSKAVDYSAGPRPKGTH